ncbi:hypothetical protein ACIOC2_01235 [Streptomyces sp. NPDC088337]|uniref:hypothetical protein n=1 Tax=unclassified Streptomyces TaxID=2593676 RepID=UPI0037F1CC42
MAREKNPDATEAELVKTAASLKKAHYQALALKSAQARRIKRELADQERARQIKQELAAHARGEAA